MASDCFEADKQFVKQNKELVKEMNCNLSR